MFTHIECEQGSDEWFTARLGVWSASNFSKIITPTGKISTQNKDENFKLIAELITGECDDTFKSSAMERGNELEGDAFDMVNFLYDFNFEKCGFLKNDNGYGCSPDGIDFEKRTGLEAKCPLGKTHVKYMIEYEKTGKMPSIYYPQVQGSMMVTGYSCWYFCSYHPEMKPLIIKIERDDKYIEAMHSEILKNCLFVSDTARKLLKNDK